MSLTFAPVAPIEITLLAVATELPAATSKAMLSSPVVLPSSAPLPMAVLPMPVVLLDSA